MKVLISGGSGFIGTALMKSLVNDGHEVWILTRGQVSENIRSHAQIINWDGRSCQGCYEIINQMDVVVNLAGESVGNWPWDSARKMRIISSRVQAGKAMADAFAKAKKKPGVFIQASGIGFYGSRGSDPVYETDSQGTDFMANVAGDWEASSSMIDNLPGVRRIVIRTSLVLDSRRGVLPKMALPVQLFVGGRLGNGKQGVSWIHIQDEVRAIRYLMEYPNARGVYNFSSPNPVSNAEFMHALARSLSRPYWFPSPAFMLRLALGEMSTLLLDGQFALPGRLLEAGFIFNYEKIQDTLNEIYR